MRERFDDETAVKMIKKAGFDSIDYSFYWISDKKLKERVFGEQYVDYAKYMREILDENNITCNQAHAPFDFTESDEFDMANENYRNLVRSMESAAILGAENIIIHSITVDDNKFDDYNYEFYKSLEKYCEEFNIHIAVENLFKRDSLTGEIQGKHESPEKMNNFIKRLNSKWFVVCIDVGHSAITGTAPEYYIENMDNKTLRALHIQDNNGKYDDHLIPYMGTLKWNDIAKALSKIKYGGELTFEIFGYLNRMENELLQDTLNYAEKVGRHIIKMIKL